MTFATTGSTDGTVASYGSTDPTSSTFNCTTKFKILAVIFDLLLKSVPSLSTKNSSLPPLQPNRTRLIWIT